MKIERGRYYTDRQVADAYQIGRSTVWAFVQKGVLPAPQKIGPRTTRFSGDDLIDFRQQAS